MRNSKYENNGTDNNSDSEFEKVHLSVVGGCYQGRCYSILTNGSKECYYSLESVLKVSILRKGGKNAGRTELRLGHPVLRYFA